jgi:hypothetical protein
MSAHPSMLQLDSMALGAGYASTPVHVQECARCAAHVTRVRQALPTPAWLRELGPSQRAARRIRPWLYGWSLAGLAVLFGGAGLLLRERPRSGDASSELGAKGMPSIAVYIKRDGAISLWDGRAPVQAGDALQLKVAVEGYSRVTVAALQEGTLTPLYAAPASGEGLLPRSWTVDDAPGPEVLLVVFSREPLTKAGQEAALAKLPRTREIWATRLQFAKKERDR